MVRRDEGATRAHREPEAPKRAHRRHSRETHGASGRGGVMIPLEKLKGVTHIITHADCPDGVASAMVLRQVLPTAEVRAIQYETHEHKKLEAKPGMLFCDFSP